MISVVGVRKCSGTSKKTGKPYSGYICFYEEERLGVEGVAAESVFLSDEVLNSRIPAVGSELELRYSRSGFLQSVEFF